MDDDDDEPLNENDDDDDLDDVDQGEDLNTQHLVLAQFDKVFHILHIILLYHIYIDMWTYIYLYILQVSRKGISSYLDVRDLFWEANVECLDEIW